MPVTWRPVGLNETGGSAPGAHLRHCGLELGHEDLSRRLSHMAAVDACANRGSGNTKRSRRALKCFSGNGDAKYTFKFAVSLLLYCGGGGTGRMPCPWSWTVPSLDSAASLGLSDGP